MTRPALFFQFFHLILVQVKPLENMLVGMRWYHVLSGGWQIWGVAVDMGGGRGGYVWAIRGAAGGGAQASPPGPGCLNTRQRGLAPGQLQSVQLWERMKNSSSNPFKQVTSVHMNCKILLVWHKFLLHRAHLQLNRAEEAPWCYINMSAPAPRASNTSHLSSLHTFRFS